MCWLSFDSYARVGRRNGNELALVFDFPLRLGVIKQTRNLAPGIWRNDSVYQGAIARDFVQGTYTTPNPEIPRSVAGPRLRDRAILR